MNVDFVLDSGTGPEPPMAICVRCAPNVEQVMPLSIVEEHARDAHQADSISLFHTRLAYSAAEFERAVNERLHHYNAPAVQEPPC